jgi:hypothetical protein
MKQQPTSFVSEIKSDGGNLLFTLNNVGREQQGCLDCGPIGLRWVIVTNKIHSFSSKFLHPSRLYSLKVICTTDINNYIN